MDKTLVILAAGMGSRYGGLKQIDPVGPNNSIIIDYSIYDAIKAGFNKVVFIIKKENQFKMVFQQVSVSILENFEYICGRKLNIEICLFSLHLRLITKLYMW